MSFAITTGEREALYIYILRRAGLAFHLLSSVVGWQYVLRLIEDISPIFTAVLAERELYIYPVYTCVMYNNKLPEGTKDFVPRKSRA